MNIIFGGGLFRALRLSLAFLALVLGLATFACAASPNAGPGAVHVLTADGDVNPVMDRYISRGIGAAEDENAAAVVIRLKTPGGLSTSMDSIVERIVNSKVPVIVYVWPSSGRAASAGTFITYAAHVAAMAPGTNIGAATPIDASGSDIGGDLGNKVKNDAVAKIRALAELRGRNADWAEDAVRKGTSVQNSEALRLHVVDLVANDLDDLLRQTDGRQVKLGSQAEIKLQTANAPVVYNDQNFIEDFLNLIADPNIAFLMLSLGSLAIFIEFVHPGAIFPGVFGVISLLLGFFALSVIPFNWAGVALILFAFILFGLEVFIVSHGILGVGGAISLVLGGLLLTSDNPPGFQVSKLLVFGLAAFLALGVAVILTNVLRIRRMPAKVGVETMVGRRAVARSPLNPTGFVFVNGEYWSAESETGEIPAGSAVIITAIQGLKLKVKRTEPEGAKA